MEKFITDFESLTQDFYSSVLESTKESLLEDAIQKSNVGWNLCNNKKELTDYSLNWNLDISNTIGIVTVEKIIRNLFPEKRYKKSFSKDSNELNETLQTLREQEHITGYRPSTKNIYTNFIYAKQGNNPDTKYEFRFGRITKEKYKLMEDGSKHIQLCNGYTLLYSGIIIFSKYNKNTLQINVNANSGRWLKIMDYLLTNETHKLPDSFWNFIPDKIPPKTLPLPKVSPPFLSKSNKLPDMASMPPKIRLP